MARIARVVLENVPHHVTQRGNARQIVFNTRKDRQLYLDLLRRNCEQSQLSIWGYCLMSNHVHLIAVPRRKDSLSRALGRTHAQYAQYWNLSRRSCGHVWQARFFSCPLGHPHLWNALAYVERNPVRAGICAQAADYQWSSARNHLRGRDPRGFLDLSVWSSRYDGASWRAMLQSNSEADNRTEDVLRTATVRGRPCANAETVLQFEQLAGRSLRPQPTGRPRKQILKPEQQARLTLQN